MCNQASQEENNENEEDNSGYLRRSESDHSESEGAGDQGNQEVHQRVIEHKILLRLEFETSDSCPPLEAQRRPLARGRQRLAATAPNGSYRVLRE